MSKQLFLIRHAHRDTADGRTLDNGLSDKGKKQADIIEKYFRDVDFDLEKTVLLSSPKKRCLETLAPLSKKIGIKIKIENLINEGSAMEFRVKEFFDWWKKDAPEVVILCSHGDWIPLAAYFFTGARIECKKGSIAEITGPMSSPILVNLIQKP